MELETVLSFQSAHSGTLAVSYVIDSRALEIGMFDPDASILPLPLHQSDFEQTAATHRDLELRSYRLRRHNGVTRIDAEYRFESLEALQIAFGRQNRPVVETGAHGTVMRQQLFSGLDRGNGGHEPQRSQRFVDEFLSDASVAVTVHAPTTISSSNLGAVDGRTLQLRYSASELLRLEAPLILELMWE